MQTSSVPLILKERRTIFKFKPDPVTPTQIQRWIDYAVWVPNHHLTEPWRFYVLTGHAQARLAQIRAEETRKKYANKPQVERVAQRDYREYAEAPAIVVVVQQASEDAIQSEEDYAACALATYNMMLAAWAEGVGSYWATGRLSRAQETAELLGLKAGDRIVGIVRLGYPAEIPPMQRKPVDPWIHWLT